MDASAATTQDWRELQRRKKTQLHRKISGRSLQIATLKQRNKAKHLTRIFILWPVIFCYTGTF